MSQTLQDVVLTRPTPADRPGAADDRFYDLVEAHLRHLITQNPLLGTYLGIHTEDHRLGDGSRDAALADIEVDRAHLAEPSVRDEHYEAPVNCERNRTSPEYSSRMSGIPYRARATRSIPRPNANPVYRSES